MKNLTVKKKGFYIILLVLVVLLLGAEQVTDFNCSNAYWELGKANYSNTSMTAAIE